MLLLAALSEGESKVTNLLDSDDIQYMLKALDVLGVKVRAAAQNTPISST